MADSMLHETGDKPPRFMPTVWALYWLAAANCRAPLVVTGPLLPLLSRDLHLSHTVGGTLTALPLMLMALLSIPGGMVADRLGPRRLLMMAVLGIGLFGGLRGFAGNTAFFLLCVALLGASIGVAQPALVHMSKSMNPKRPDLATSVYANGFVVGALMATFLSPVVFLPMAGTTGWRGVLWIWALVALAVVAGMAIFRAPQRHEILPPVSARQFAALVKSPGLIAVGVAFASQSAIFYALMTWLPTYYVGLHWSFADASLPSTIISLGSIPGVFIAPLLARKWNGIRPAMVLMGLITLTGVLGFWLLPGWGLLWGFFPGVGTSGALTLGLAAPNDLAPPNRVGAVAGILLAIGYLGAVPGSLLVGVLRDLEGQFTLGFVYLALIAVVLTFIGMAIPKNAGSRFVR